MPTRENTESAQLVTESKPGPDPSFLTTQQLLREIAMSRDIVEARLGGIDKINELAMKFADKVTEHVRHQLAQGLITHEEKFNVVSVRFGLQDEKFASIAIQFAERDKRTAELALANSTAITAALQAAEKAVEKQTQSTNLATTTANAATEKKLDLVSVTVNTVNAALNDKVDEVKKNMAALELRTSGGQRDYIGQVLSIIAIIGVVGLSITIAILRH